MAVKIQIMHLTNRDEKLKKPTTGLQLIDIELNIEMARAGAAALREWDRETEAEELAAVEVFYAMLKCTDTFGSPSSSRR